MRTVDCSLCKYLKIVPAERDAYQKLAQYHYRDGELGPVKAIYAMTDEHPQRKAACPVVGVIVYGCPAANLAVRSIAAGGIFASIDRAAALALLNAQMLTIKRVIIEPRYRGLGLAARLVRQTMPMTRSPMVEAIAVMGQAHPFFAHAGMTEYKQPPDVKTERMRAAFETVGIDERLWTDAEQVHLAINALDKQQRRFINDQVQNFLQKFATQRQMSHSLDRTEFVLGKLSAPGRYYLWINQKAKSKCNMTGKKQKPLRSATDNRKVCTI